MEVEVATVPRPDTAEQHALEVKAVEGSFKGGWRVGRWVAEP